jgi:hypothetical protein
MERDRGTRCSDRRTSCSSRLRRAEGGEPELVGHVIPLLARSDVLLEAMRVLRRRIPRVLGRSATQRAADGLLLGLADPVFGVRRQCAATLARVTEREPAIDVPRGSIFAAVVREMQGAPEGWTEDVEPAATEDSSPEARPQTPTERGLAHVFTLLSLAVDREPLQIAYWALLGADPALRGTALEYLENVLPDDVRRALWPHVGARARASTTARARQHVVQDLMRASETLGLSRQAMKRLLPPR